jgi:hypothetical protein
VSALAIGAEDWLLVRGLWLWWGEAYLGASDGASRINDLTP